MYKCPNCNQELQLEEVRVELATVLMGRISEEKYERSWWCETCQEVSYVIDDEVFIY